MGELIDGQWQRQPFRADGEAGVYTRKSSVFRAWITPDGRPGPSGEGGFPAEPGRYHLYVSLACPWAHRTLIVRALKGLEALVGVSVVNWLMDEDGWTFAPGPGVVPDMVNHKERLYELYVLADPRCTTRATVPVLWDKQRRTIVSNESSEIIRMFGSAFDRVGAAPGDLYPEALRDEIEAVNARVYATVNNGVYRAGFATAQAAYEEAVTALFGSLDWLEERLAGRRFVVGDRLTEADIRLFTTLIRFDPVYHGHFKCNRKLLADYAALSAYLEGLAAHPAIAPTINLDHIKRHYYMSHRTINPTGIVPLGPAAPVGGPG